MVRGLYGCYGTVLHGASINADIDMRTKPGDGKQRKAGREMRQTWALWNREFQLGGQREQGTGRERGRYRYRQEH